jgi:hypothetical protein
MPKRILRIAHLREALTPNVGDPFFPSDYEPCGDCGYDHDYEPRHAYEWHTKNPGSYVGIMKVP